MRTRLHTTVFLTLCLLPGSQLLHAQSPTKGVDLKLISEVHTIQTGQPFTVGLHIHHHNGFHTYWRSPGIVGLSTQLDWTLPAGFSAGPIQWPTPEIVDMAGHPAHGFHRDVLLMVDVIPPKKLAAKEVTLKAAATWMACADSCHPGNTTLQITLPVAATAAFDPAHQAFFKTARAELPRPFENCPVELISAAGAPIINLRFTPPKSLRGIAGGVYFFSSDGQVSSDKPQKLALEDTFWFLTLQRAEFGPKQASTLPGVLRIRTDPGPEGLIIGTINPAFPDKNPDPSP